jgi:hypothetical protein
MSGGREVKILRTMRRGAMSAASRRACARLILTFCLLPFYFCLNASSASAQEVVDRMVATINGRELVTYTDLLWQLALQPNTPLDNPRTQDLQEALDRLIDQRLISEEAGRLPTITPRDEQVAAAIADLVKRFPSQTAFQERIARVGLTNEQLREIISERLEIENYLDFRFRSFVVIPQKEIADYYRDTYLPRFRREHPGVIVPTLEQAQQNIERTLTEAKVGSDINAFLEDARSRAEIVILDPALAKG